jgi:hypothetical protein
MGSARPASGTTQTSWPGVGSASIGETSINRLNLKDDFGSYRKIALIGDTAESQIESHNVRMASAPHAV